MDGAMGTMLYARGVFVNRCFDELNLSAPELVQAIHRDYVRAGADIIETNTFGANRLRLAGHGFASRVADINHAGARLARSCAAASVHVAGSIGPLGIRIEPWGPTSLQEAREAFAEQARALAEGGVDLLILETFVGLGELEQAIEGVRSACDLPIVAQLTVGHDGVSLEGTPPEEFVPRIESRGVAVLGLNCGMGPQAMLEAIERVAEVAPRPRLSAIPNAGLPRSIDGRNLYLCSPDYMASYARRFLRAGVGLVGGCCGTTPEHIQAIKQAVRSGSTPRRPQTSGRPSARPSVAPAREPLNLGGKSRLGAALEAKRFVSGVALLPPRGWEVPAAIEVARALHQAGVDYIEIPEDAEGTARLSSLATATLVQRELGAEIILDYSCRERRLLGMQADLLGAYALGIRNVLALTGDPPERGELPEARATEVDAIGLTNILHRLNEGRDLGGNQLAAPTGFCIGVGADPGAVDLEREVRRFRYKVEAGAEFALTRPIFDVEALRRFLERIAAFRIPILAGVWP
ncbi:MAG: bifunctional homocysteine S-methyltransferase/methylenetetrahydrofolate reductase, partial [Acidobacteriota bacterium]